MARGFKIWAFWYLDCVRDFKLSVFDMFVQEIMTHVDVLRVSVGDRVNRQLDRTIVVLKNLDARIPKPGMRKRHTDRRIGTSLKPSAIATCSASLEESVVNVCFLQMLWMDAPARMTAPPDADFLLVRINCGRLNHYL